MRVQALVPEPAVEGLHKGIVGRLARPAEIQRYPIDVGPVIEPPEDELGAIAHWEAPLSTLIFEGALPRSKIR